MPADLRKRHRRAAADGPSDSETDAAMSDTASHDVYAAPPAATHSKGENKAGKMKKRLIFGSLLLVALCCIITAGHLWTLALVRDSYVHDPRFFWLARASPQAHTRDQPSPSETSPTHPPQVLLVQVAMFRELVNVRYSHRKFHDVPLFRTSQWGWFFSCLVYSYGHSFLDPDRRSLISSRLILSLLPYVELSALLLYSLMLMVTVLTFTKGYYKYQVGQLAWTIAIIVITVVQVHSFTANVLNGLFWFLFPVSLVICNDSMAYFCGLAFGRRFIRKRFLELSPNKTWEGFIGGGTVPVPATLEPAPCPLEPFGRASGRTRLCMRVRRPAAALGGSDIRFSRVILLAQACAPSFSPSPPRGSTRTCHF